MVTRPPGTIAAESQKGQRLGAGRSAASGDMGVLTAITGGARDLLAIACHAHQEKDDGDNQPHRKQALNQPRDNLFAHQLALIVCDVRRRAGLRPARTTLFTLFNRINGTQEVPDVR